jgi:hypothetical protein
MSNGRITDSSANACDASPSSTAAGPAGQVALRMAQYKRAARRHPRAAMGALAHWLRTLDQTPARSAGEPAAHGTNTAPKCAAQQTSAVTSQK